MIVSVGLLVTVAVTWDSDKERQSKVIIKLATSYLIGPLPLPPPPPPPSLSQIKGLTVRQDSSRVRRHKHRERGGRASVCLTWLAKACRDVSEGFPRKMSQHIPSFPRVNGNVFREASARKLSVYCFISSTLAVRVLRVPGTAG